MCLLTNRSNTLLKTFICRDTTFLVSLFPQTLMRIYDLWPFAIIYSSLLSSNSAILSLIKKCKHLIVITSISSSQFWPSLRFMLSFSRFLSTKTLAMTLEMRRKITLVTMVAVVVMVRFLVFTLHFNHLLSIHWRCTFNRSPVTNSIHCCFVCLFTSRFSQFYWSRFQISGIKSTPKFLQATCLFSRYGT